MADGWIAQEIERTVYAIAGLPIAIRGKWIPGSPAAKDIRGAFARRYWRPRSLREAGELIIGLLLAPLAVPLGALWFTMHNGPIIRRREGKGLAAQFVEQLRLYASAGIVGPWYYILSLHRDGMRRAPSFLQRAETKRGLYSILRDKHGSPLGQKDAFARRCAAAGVRCVPCEAVISGGDVEPVHLPDCDLFVKPLEGCGGKGAERWNRVAARTWSNGKMTLGDSGLIEHVKSKRRTMVVQKRLRPHAALQRLTSGAVPTVRALTCLDEQGGAELVAAVFRMSMGENRTVDNIHAGGLACAVSLADGVLGLASDLGSDASLGWCRDHPTTGARIEGTLLPYWGEVRALAVTAHQAFADRVLIGWDIAIQDDGPTIIEGNRGPDMDLMQRFMDVGFYEHQRMTELIAHHLRARGHLEWAGGRDRAASVVRVDAQRQ